MKFNKTTASRIIAKVVADATSVLAEAKREIWKQKVSSNHYIKQIVAKAELDHSYIGRKGKIDVHDLDERLAKTDLSATDRLNLKSALHRAGLLDD